MEYDYKSFRARPDWRFCCVVLAALFVPALLVGVGRLLGWC